MYSLKVLRLEGPGSASRLRELGGEGSLARRGSEKARESSGRPADRTWYAARVTASSSTCPIVCRAAPPLVGRSVPAHRGHAPDARRYRLGKLPRRVARGLSSPRGSSKINRPMATGTRAYLTRMTDIASSRGASSSPLRGDRCSRAGGGGL